MREYLFRGKRLDNGEWVEGDLSQDRDLGTAYIQGYDYYCDGGGLQREPFGFEVDPETVGQFTGGVEFSHNEEDETLGRNIFEGDIVQISSGYSKSTGNFLLIWNEEISGFSWKHLSGKQKFFDEEIVGMKVIGNRWDNPELLEGTS